MLFQITPLVMPCNSAVKVLLLALLLAVQIFEITTEFNAENTAGITVRAGDPKLLQLSSNPTPDVIAEKAFIDNPLQWLGQNSISSFPVNWYSSRNPRTRLSLVNGGIYSFRFTKVADKKYVYYASSESDVGVKGYWLSTAEKISVLLNDGPAFIFTGELQGCSIHTRILFNSRLEVFHRNRQYLYQIYVDGYGNAIDERGDAVRELEGVTKFLDKDGKEIHVVPDGKISLNNGILDKNGHRVTKINGREVENLLDDNLNRGTDEMCQFLNYDLSGGKSVSWAEYNANLPDNFLAVVADSRNGPKFTTPFLFRKNHKWAFVSQQIQYSGLGGTGSGFGSDKMYDFHFTGYGYFTNLH
ncbi:hypothetical protein HA402_002335 [Bradysia odoriphaga]|nr:hypothetical protein HA402_002335 [Bradysia odoriphaga]